VTGEQIEAFLAEVHKQLGIRQLATSGSSIGQIRFEKRGDIRVPHIPMSGRICNEEGKVVDGREGLLFDLSRLTVRGNPHAAADEAGQAGLRHAIYEAFCERAVTHTSSIGGKRVARYATDEGIRADIADKVYRMCRALGSAPVQPIENVEAYAHKAGGTTKKATVSLALANRQAQKREEAKTEYLPIAALGEWLAPGGYVTRAVKGVTVTLPETSYAEQSGHGGRRDVIIRSRAIPLDVRETSARVTRETTTAITSPLIDLLTPDAPEGVTIVRGLPGTGQDHDISQGSRRPSTGERGASPGSYASSRSPQSDRNCRCRQGRGPRCPRSERPWCRVHQTRRRQVGGGRRLTGRRMRGDGPKRSG
jgi:hypothetical protein